MTYSCAHRLDRLRASGLCVPHPRLEQRAFVLEPLAELAPERVLPDSGRTVAEALAALARRSSGAPGGSGAPGAPGAEVVR